jgi:FMN phosphatase YigB (HAD superfamily)
MILLIDAVKTLIVEKQEDDFESRTLNTELADYLATRQDTIVVVTNARGDRGKKIRDLISEYSFEYHSMDNTTPKTDPEYWAHVIMYYGFDTEDCFYLDHSEDNLDAAAEIGIEGELFVNNDQAIEVLQSIVVK